ncbi:hypothetical protein L218DRAFT_845596, partial [Marasmius fiardii PR-910]
HPYTYAQVIRIFHANVCLAPSLQTNKILINRCIDFLWPRWYKLNMTCKPGFKAKRMYHLSFPSPNDPRAFGFLSLEDLYKHLISSCASTIWRQLSSNRKQEHEEEDWKYYYINMFVDRDMFMWYQGSTIGHIQFHEY